MLFKLQNIRARKFFMKIWNRFSEKNTIRKLFFYNDFFILVTCVLIPRIIFVSLNKKNVFYSNFLVSTWSRLTGEVRHMFLVNKLRRKCVLCLFFAAFLWIIYAHFRCRFPAGQFLLFINGVYGKSMYSNDCCMLWNVFFSYSFCNEFSFR